MSTPIRGPVSASVIAALLLCAPVLAAESKADPKTAEAKAHFKQGSQLYKQARYHEAIAEFETAYELKPHGVLRFNIAQCFEKLGDIPQALKSYHQYLREAPDAEDRATVQAAMTNLEKRLVEKGLQQLLVYSEPPGVEVRIDEKVLGKTPWAGELALGKHSVRLSANGYEAATRGVELAADRSLELDLTLLAASPPIATLPPPPPPVAPAEAVGPKPTPAPPVDTRTELTPKPRVWTWVVAGVAGAALISAVGCGAGAKSSSNSLLGSQHPRQQSQDLHDKAKAEQTAANVLYGIGGAAGIASVVLFFSGRF
jgi:tetratricopeptide (TPR) repeat protein